MHVAILQVQRYLVQPNMESRFGHLENDKLISNGNITNKLASNEEVFRPIGP